MEEPEDIFKQGYKFDEAKYRIRLIELLTTNQTLLRSVLLRQLEIQETLNGLPETEMKEKVKERYAELNEKIYEASNKTYLEYLSSFLY